MAKSKWSIVKFHTGIGNGIVFIADDNGPKSVTNDAENVVQELNELYPNARVIYRDSDGRWDELVHEGGVFKRFAPIDKDLRFHFPML